RLCRTLAAEIRTGRIRRDQVAEHADFSRLFLEGMAVNDFTCGSAGPRDFGWVRRACRAKAVAARVGAGPGTHRIVRSVCLRTARGCRGIPQRSELPNRER